MRLRLEGLPGLSVEVDSVLLHLRGVVPGILDIDCRVFQVQHVDEPVATCFKDNILLGLPFVLDQTVLVLNLGKHLLDSHRDGRFPGLLLLVPKQLYGVTWVPCAELCAVPKDAHVLLGLCVVLDGEVDLNIGLVHWAPLTVRAM